MVFLLIVSVWSIIIKRDISVLFCDHSFNEPCSLVSKHQKKSLASNIQLMELLKDPHLTFKKVSELLNLSSQTVMNSFYQNLPVHVPVLPKVLCIDEVYFGKNASKKICRHITQFLKLIKSLILFMEERKTLCTLIFNEYLLKVLITYMSHF